MDMDRLLDFTDGNSDSLRELITLYLQQTSQQLEQLEAAVQAGSAHEVKRIAHSCAGASATCGMKPLAKLLREMEREGVEERLEQSPRLQKLAEQEFERIRSQLERCLAVQPEPAAKS